MHQSDQDKPDARELRPSSGSLWALDGLNFFLADVRDGMGPFLGTFLREHHQWDAGRVGIALAASQIGTVLAQTPAGALIDRIRWKRVAIAVAAAVVAAGCVLLYFVPTLPVVVAAQTAIGAAAAIFPPAVAAVTLGLVGRAMMPRQTGRNEAYNHAGNVVAAALAGGCAYFIGYGAMFFLVAAMAAASASAVMLICEREIDHDLARGADDGRMMAMKLSVCTNFQGQRILTFIASAVLFHFANAAMLPLVGQKSSDGLKDGAAIVMSACIIAAQIVMIPVALAASSGGIVGPQASFPDRVCGPADPWLALLPVYQPGVPGDRPALGWHRGGHLWGGVDSRGRRPHQGDGAIQLDAGCARHGNRNRRRAIESDRWLPRQGSRF